MSSEETPSTYVESPIIMTTVRVVAPFVLAFGLFVMFHGAESAGGGFQGGVIAGAVILMLAFAYGIEPTREWLGSSLLAIAAVTGVVVFAVVGLGAIVLGGSFLEYPVYGIHHASKYGIELVELGIGATVAGVITSLFFLLAAGVSEEVDEA
ncbi:cation:proton antiporter [Halorhabdus sp. CBA1104]|uniref:MnhB domain-containing protein n=1 Tax=unclassified Halorhabdus TaxID=2621901 RepID=UPI0012B3C6F6|nr:MULTISPECIES: MnhB domain-containing protein [unclassified Halorhabdus]QGN06635.1 cation:proton antiporter [Halorhabdus sp. CBA1104]